MVGSAEVRRGRGIVKAIQLFRPSDFTPIAGRAVISLIAFGDGAVWLMILRWCRWRGLVLSTPGLTVL
jgi:hypothetical protein